MRWFNAQYPSKRIVCCQAVHTFRGLAVELDVCLQNRRAGDGQVNGRERTELPQLACKVGCHRTLNEQHAAVIVCELDRLHELQEYYVRARQLLATLARCGEISTLLRRLAAPCNYHVLQAARESLALTLEPLS